MDLSKAVTWICQPWHMDFSELLFMDLSKLIEDEKFIVLLHLRKRDNVNNGWLGKEDNYTLVQKRRKNLSTGYEDKSIGSFGFVTIWCGLKKSLTSNFKEHCLLALARAIPSQCTI